MKQFLTVFTTIFVAEIGDKTQMAALLFSTESNNGRLGVFLASAAALVTSIALTVLAGGLVTRFIPPMALKITAGICFILVGIWTLISASS